MAEAAAEDSHQPVLQLRADLAEQAEKMRIAHPRNRSALAKDRIDPVFEDAANPCAEGCELGGRGGGPHIETVAEALRLRPFRTDAADQFLKAAVLFQADRQGRDREAELKFVLDREKVSVHRVLQFDDLPRARFNRA